MDDRWPYPVSQRMQRQTGSRIKPALGMPPTVTFPKAMAEPDAIQEQIEIQNEAQNSNAPERLPA